MWNLRKIDNQTDEKKESRLPKFDQLSPFQKDKKDDVPSEDLSSLIRRHPRYRLLLSTHRPAAKILLIFLSFTSTAVTGPGRSVDDPSPVHVALTKLNRATFEMV